MKKKEKPAEKKDKLSCACSRPDLLEEWKKNEEKKKNEINKKNQPSGS